MKSYFIKTALLASLLAISSFSFASVSAENIQLSRINSILNSVYPLINAAQKQAVPNERVQFHYQWLRSDIQAIQSGIAQKVNTPAIAPRVVSPLNTQFSGTNIPKDENQQEKI